MSALTSPAVSPRSTERRVEEILNELLKSYFTGRPHAAPLGDVTFPLCTRLFNQTEIDAPSDRQPQIHTVFGELRPHETWFTSGNLSAWESTLAAPASGVAYGLTPAGTIEESVHGKLVRTLTGTDLRWQAAGADYVEQVFRAGWQTTRTFTGASGLRWVRTGSDYVEQTLTGSTWGTIRTVSVSNQIWDGTKCLITAPLRLSLWVRAINSGGDGNRNDWTCRTVADNLHELLNREDIHAALGQKGLRHLRVQSGPTPMQTTGYQTRLLIVTCQLRYFLPRQL